MQVLTHKEETKKQRINKLWSQLDYERASYIPHWQAISDNISPRRAVFNGNDPNKSGRRNGNIVDIVGTLAERTLKSGMMAGITSQAREWFRLTTQDPDLADLAEVKEWLSVVTDRMNTVFSRSNFYNQVPDFYGDGGSFGTGAMLIEEDLQTVVKFRTYEVGTYYIANDANGNPCVFMRDFPLTVRQLIEDFAEKDENGAPAHFDNFSKNVQDLYQNGKLETPIQVRHAIYPNPQYDGKGLSKFTKKYSSCYYECPSVGQRGTSGEGGGSNLPVDDKTFLRESGYDIFPVLVFRWGLRTCDSYGSTCPGMIALGLISAIQLMHKRKAQAIELKVRPPMNAPISMKQSANTTIAGGINWIPDEAGDKSFKPTFEVNFDTRELTEYMAEIKDAIKESYFVNLFNAVLSDFRSQPRTAEEMRQLLEEKLSMIGPVLEQIHPVLKALIDATFYYMRKQGLIPMPPESLRGEPLRVEYVSILAQAQKALGIGTLERFIADIQAMAALDPSVIDNVDWDVAVRKLADMSGVAHGIVEEPEEVQAKREARAQQQQAAAAQEQLAASVKATKDLSETKLDQGSALDRMAEQAAE